MQTGLSIPLVHMHSCRKCCALAQISMLFLFAFIGLILEWFQMSYYVRISSTTVAAIC